MVAAGKTKRLHVAIAVAPIDDAMEGLPGQEVHQLREQRLACVHKRLRVSYPRIGPERFIYDARAIGGWVDS